MFIVKTNAAPAAARPCSPLGAADEHDLRTPLTVVRATAEILRDYADLPDADRVRLLDALATESERLSHAIERILDVRYTAPPRPRESGQASGERGR